MTFAYPWGLLALVVPLALAVWQCRTQRPEVTLPIDHGEYPARRVWRALLLAANLLPPVLLGIAILLACRPQRLEPPRQERRLTNIEFLLDCSASMTSQFGSGSRYDAAMSALQDFTNRRQGDAFGLTVFGNEVIRWTPLTKDLSAIRNATPFLRPELLPQQFGGTEIGKAVRYSQATLLDRGEGDRLLILLSDGISADLHNGVAQKLGASLAADQILLCAVFISEDGPPAQLQEMTRANGGRLFAAGNREALQAVFEHIDKMQPVKLKPAAPRRIDYFGPLSLAGLVVAGLYQLSLFGLRYSPW